MSDPQDSPRHRNPSVETLPGPGEPPLGVAADRERGHPDAAPADPARPAEAAHAEQFLESVVENIPAMIFVKDAAELRFVRVNKAEQEMLGIPADRLIGRNDHDLFPADEADFFTSKDRAVLASGELLDIPEEPILTARGPRVLHTKKIPLLDPAGRPQYLLGISEDITDRKQAEHELREKNRLLEEAARAEHAALTALGDAQGRLVQSEKLAALGQLVAGVAHEINNPLAFVTNNVVVLQRDFAELRELLDLYRSADASLAAADPAAAARIAAAAERMDLDYTLSNLDELLARSREGLKRIQQIVKDLRSFSRHESVGDVQEDADLNAGVTSTVNIAGGRARGRGVTLETDLGALPPVPCQPSRINQVVLNLVANAIDASPSGGRVTIATRAVAGGVEVEVVDAGPGVDPAVLGRIFDPFFTTKPQGQGTGLGLSISHGIVADHGGTIVVDSAPGRGARFVVRLPLCRPAEGDGRKP
jgi:two-component system NtrC family sensor kinase